MIELKSLPLSADLKTVKEVFAEFEGVGHVRFCTSPFFASSPLPVCISFLVDRNEHTDAPEGKAYFVSVEMAKKAMKVLASSELTIGDRLIEATYGDEGHNPTPPSRTLRISGLPDNKDRLQKILQHYHFRSGISRMKLGA